MVYLIEYSKDGGKSWEVYQPAGIYRTLERCTSRALDQQKRYADLPRNNRFHGYLYRATAYAPAEAR